MPPEAFQTSEAWQRLIEEMTKVSELVAAGERGERKAHVAGIY